MIEVRDLSKTYGDVVAVDRVSFDVRPGLVTGFLGPNGAGKSTTMRMILNLDRPSSGEVMVNGRRYVDAEAPLREIGALLEPRVDKGRSARNHLRALGATIGITDSRVEEVLELVGLSKVARKPAGSFSLGMGQRLGIAGALLGDPAIVMLDEPVNGLDPDGVLWMRGLLRDLAERGRTVFLSSHLMSEMELIADHLIVIGRGRLLADLSMNDFIAQAGHLRVVVASPDAARLAELLRVEPGVTVSTDASGNLVVSGIEAQRIGLVASERSFVLHELHTVRPSLEEAFMDLTSGSVAYQARSTSTSATTSSGAEPRPH